MSMQDHQPQDIEHIMRRAEALGHDPERVARALKTRPPHAAEREKPELQLAQHDPPGQDVAPGG
jgi:hypothetical protein